MVCTSKSKGGGGGVKIIAVVCVGSYTNTPRRKTLTGGVIFTTSGSISRITRIMLTYEVNDLADLGMILTGFG